MYVLLCSADTKSATFQALWQIGVLCNRANFDPKQMDEPVDTRQTFGTLKRVVWYFEEGGVVL